MTEQTLRDLARAGAPSIVPPPLLAERVLALRSRSVRRQRVAVSLALTGLLTGGVVAARSAGHARFYDVYTPSSSMKPTLGIGENLVADRTLDPQRDDVVQLSVQNKGDAFLSVRRIIGLPGDVIACPATADGYCHSWSRNGKPLPEPWIGRDRLDPPGDPAPRPGFFLADGSSTSRRRPPPWRQQGQRRRLAELHPEPAGTVGRQGRRGSGHRNRWTSASDSRRPATRCTWTRGHRRPARCSPDHR